MLVNLCVLIMHCLVELTLFHYAMVSLYEVCIMCDVHVRVHA